ncbi:hypothetical protein BsWGS_23993 [Bradybaena similaris]
MVFSSFFCRTTSQQPPNNFSPVYELSMTHSRTAGTPADYYIPARNIANIVFHCLSFNLFCTYSLMTDTSLVQSSAHRGIQLSHLPFYDACILVLYFVHLL